MTAGPLDPGMLGPTRAGAGRFRRLVRRSWIPLALMAMVLVIGTGAQGFLTSTASGGGTATVGGPLAPATIDPAGAPDFDLSDMYPGEVSSQTVTVTAPAGGTTDPSQLAIYEPDASGALLPDLSLKVVEDGTTVVYDGPLATGWTAASPLVLPGTAATGLWDRRRAAHVRLHGHPPDVSRQ